MLLSFFLSTISFLFIVIIFYIIFLYTNLPCFVKRPRAIVIDWALYKYFYYYYYRRFCSICVFHAKPRTR